MLQPWQTGKIIRIADETDATRRFWIQLTETDNFDFKPGQFVTLDLPIHEQRNKRWRSYSIASWPDGTNVIELVIVLLEGGLGTQYLFHEVTVGSEVLLRGPQGVFVLPETIETDLYFVCTGTGIAPFRAMTHHILNLDIPHKEIFLIFGCRKFSDALYGAEMRELTEKVTSFRYIPTFSRESPGEHLYRTGYVHAVYEDLIREKQTTVPGGQYAANFFLCGWKNMIDEAKQRILSLGYEKKSIHLELYG
ncbi:ferredoxin--NADP reductase [Flavihumibacter petaseus]|uniref:Putative oxidoreductase n=1 Tax=Flavihumibacter petaseus NBRC 106054 TaxID=1220578 RepID=A0A0E9MW04_9BACT|nr:FAD-dependent oxidoreductase [Flavihumibacter petaseus]GAO41683.1 putative oxidoreductase [Flavihumibacter petaseus NBRC 106054]